MKPTVSSRLDSIDKRLENYNEQLTVHIKRQETMENRFELEKEYVDRSIKELREGFNSLPVRTLQWLSLAAALFTFWKLF